MQLSKSFRRLTLGSLALLVAAVMVAPTSLAQSSPSIEIDKVDPPGALFPEVDSGQLKVTVNYKLPSQAYSLGGAVSVGVPITVRPQCPSTILIDGTQNKIATVEAPVQEVSIEFTFQVTISRQAPGLQAISCTVTATAGALNDPFVPAPDSSASQSFSLKADYYSLVQSKVATKLKQAGPQKEVPFEIELSNFGNARTQIAFAVANEPTGGKWSILLPDNLILDTPNGGAGKTQDISTVTISTTFKNGWNNEQGAFQILMTPTAADQAEKTGNTLSANVLVRVRGVYVPGFEPMVLVGAVLGSALLVRMTGRDEE